jgi:hypothetical protein
MQADNVRMKLEGIMQKHDLELLSLDHEQKLYTNIRKCLLCGCAVSLLYLMHF